MLIRPAERTLIGLTTRELAFLVDGRAARLPRAAGRGRRDAAAPRAPARRAARPGLHRHLGDDRHRRRPRRAPRRAIAEAGRKLFGVEVPPDHVVEETLQRVATVPVPEGRERARRGRRAPSRRQPEREAVRGHPLAAWVEATFGLAVQDERLVRRTPLCDSRRAWSELVEATGLDPRAVPTRGSGPCSRPATPRRCRAASRCSPSACTSSWPRAAASTRRSSSRPVRALSTEGQVYAPNGRRGRAQGCSTRSRSAASAGRRRTWSRGSASTRRSGSVPRSPLLNAPEDEIPGEALFFTSRTIRSGARARTCPTAGTSRAPGSRASRNATGRTCPSTSGCARTGWSAACRWTARSRAGCSPSR